VDAVKCDKQIQYQYRGTDNLTIWYASCVKDSHPIDEPHQYDLPNFVIFDYCDD